MKINKGLPLNQRVDPGQDKLKAKLKDAAKLYEQQFLREMVKAMRSTVSTSELTKPSMAEKIYRQKLDHQYVDNWSDRGGVGLADVIYKQLSEKFLRQQQGLPRPKGPMPLEQMKNIKSPSLNQQPNQSQFLIEGIQGAPVTSPWAGKISQLSEVEGEKKLLQINHLGGLQSRLYFQGAMEGLKIGEPVAAGQKLGMTTVQQPFVSWNVNQSRITERPGANV